MATNSVRVTLQIRNDSSTDWTARNPVLGEGEFGLENNTFLIKVGDGVTDWQHLPYLNKLDPTYFKLMSDGSLTFSDSFAQDINNIIANAGGDAHLVIADDPEVDTDPVGYSFLRRYVTEAISAAGHLTRTVVQTLPVSDISETTIYMVPNAGGTGYDEYMYIDNTWDVIGTTGEYSGYVLPVATTAALGGVKAVNDPTSDYLNVTQEGFMALNKVSTSKLYVPTGDTLIIYGGTA